MRPTDDRFLFGVRESFKYILRHLHRYGRFSSVVKLKKKIQTLYLILFDRHLLRSIANFAISHSHRLWLPIRPLSRRSSYMHTTLAVDQSLTDFITIWYVHNTTNLISFICNRVENSSVKKHILFVLEQFVCTGKFGVYQ